MNILDFKNDRLVIKKDFYSFAEKDLISALKIPVDSYGDIDVSINNISKQSLHNLLSYTYPQIYNSQEYLTFFSTIKQSYSKAYEEFLVLAKERIPYFDKLYPHQQEALYFICCRRKTILSLEQGLGKTITSISKCLMFNYKKTLIITPSSLKYNWYEELLQWGFNKDIISIIDSKHRIKAPKERYVIINYELIKKYKNYILEEEFDNCIIDECHFIKNIDSKRTKLVKDILLKKNIPVVLLSGTPAPNKIVDMFSYLQICNHQYGKSYNDFLKRFTVFFRSRFGIQIKQAKDIEILRRGLSNIMYRKTKDECISLPEKIYTKLTFENEEYKEEYDLAFEMFLNTLSKSKGAGEIEMALHSLNIITCKAKIKSIIEYVESYIEDGNKIVLTTSYKEPIRLLQEHFKDKCVVVDGSVSDARVKMQLINQFKTDDKVKILIGNMKAIGTGYNLTNTTCLMFINFPYTRGEIEQVADRLHRIGQTGTVNILFAVCKDSIDERLYKIIASKYKDVSKLIDGVQDNSDFDEQSFFENLKQLAA